MNVINVNKSSKSVSRTILIILMPNLTDFNTDWAMHPKWGGWTTPTFKILIPISSLKCNYYNTYICSEIHQNDIHIQHVVKQVFPERRLLRKIFEYIDLTFFIFLKYKNMVIYKMAFSADDTLTQNTLIHWRLSADDTDGWF